MALAALLLAALLIQGFLCAPGKTPHNRHSDLVPYHLGVKTVLAQALAQGHGLPFWRDDLLSGGPALTQPQALYTSPFHVLFWLCGPLQAAGGTFFLLLLFGGVGCFFWGRVLGLGLAARTLMGLAGMTCFKLLLAVYAGWLSILPAIVLVPWLLAATMRTSERPTLGNALGLGLLGGLGLHAGHLQVLYLAGWVAAALVVAAAVRRVRQREWAALRRQLAAVGGAAALALGLGAYLWGPTLAEASLISRADASYEFFVGRNALGARHLLTLLHPEALGTPLDDSFPGAELWEEVAYFGIVPLLLALGGIAARWRAPQTRFFVGAFAVTALLAFDTPLLAACHGWLPGFDVFRNPARILFVTAFCGIALAGLGADALFGWLVQRRGRRVAAAAVGAALALVALEGAVYARRYLQMVPCAQALPTLAFERRLPAAAHDPYRVASIGRSTLNSGWAAAKGLALIGGYEPYNLRHYQRYFDLLQWGPRARPHDARVWTDLRAVAREDLLDVLGVRYLLAPWPLPAGGRYEELARWPAEPRFVFYRGLTRAPLWLYRNHGARARAFFTDDVRGVRDELQMIAEVQRRDLHRTAVVLGESGHQVAPGTSGRGRDGDRVRVLRGGFGELELALQAKRRRFLVISEVWHPGWHAELDGAPIALRRTNVALLGAWIPPGAQRLVARFRPLYWRPCVAISATSLLALVALACAAWLRRRHGSAVAVCSGAATRGDTG